MELTKFVKSLLIANILLFLATYLGFSFIGDLILYPNKEYFQIYQLVTYMFLHASVVHIIFNMFALVIFGTEIEKRIGGIKFLQIYLISGLFAGLTHMLFLENPVVGASGSIWSLMVIYALLYPERIFNLYFIFPIKIKYIISALFILEVILLFMEGDGTSHAAHIGGALTGFVYYQLNKKNI